MEFDDWLQIGWVNGWCSPPCCSTHDGVPTSDAEDEEFEDGDPCIHVLRLYADAAERDAVTSAGGPVQWRASNRGWVSTDGVKL